MPLAGWVLAPPIDSDEAFLASVAAAAAAAHKRIGSDQCAN